MSEALNRPEQPVTRRQRLRRGMVIVAGSVMIACGGISAASEVGHAFLQNPGQFVNNVVAVARGDMGIRNFGKFAVEESGRDPLCQQAVRQTLEEAAGRGNVYSIPHSVLGYALNNQSLCLEGLTGLTETDIDTTAAITEGFPAVNGFDREITTNDGVVTATYTHQGVHIASITNLENTTAEFVTPADYDACITDESCRAKIIAGGSPMTTGFEGDYRVDSQWPYLWWINQGVAGQWLHLDVTQESVVANPDYVTLSIVDGTYEVGMLTEDRLADVVAGQGLAFASPFNFKQGAESTAEAILDAGAVFKDSGMMAICHNAEGSYVMSIPGQLPDNKAAEFFLAAGYALTSAQAQDNCVIYDDEGNMAYVANGDQLTPVSSNPEVVVMRFSENRFNPFLVIRPAN